MKEGGKGRGRGREGGREKKKGRKGDQVMGDEREERKSERKR